MSYFSRELGGWSSPNLEDEVGLAAYGAFGPPVVLIPQPGADALAPERAGLVAALEPELAAGRLKLYVLPSVDERGWLAEGLSAEARLEAQLRFDRWMTEEVVPFVRHDCRHRTIRPALVGWGFGAFHAINTLCRHPQLFDRALALSGRFDISAQVAGCAEPELYYHQPLAYLPRLDDHVYLPRLQRRPVVLGAGSEELGFETPRMAAILEDRGLPLRRASWEGGASESAWVTATSRELPALLSWEPEQAEALA